MNAARRLFLIAGIYGLVVLLPQFFFEARIGHDGSLATTSLATTSLDPSPATAPPGIAHAEYFYGFLAVAAAWQLAFLVIASDPLRYRPLMIPSAIEKIGFAAVVAMLVWQGRAPTLLPVFAGIDFVLGLLFLMAFRRLGRLV